jgi:hypothetical protein
MKQQILIGFYGEGGHGSHPLITKKENLLLAGFKNPADGYWSKGENSFFQVLLTINYIPKALLATIDLDGWRMKPFTIEEGISLFGTDKEYSKYITHKDPLFAQIEKEFPNTDGDGTGIVFIPRPKLDFIYWSDNPELTHGYWKIPSIEKTIYSIETF